MEQLNYNLMYRWFVGLSPDDPVWDPTTFTKNRDRLQGGAIFIGASTGSFGQVPFVLGVNGPKGLETAAAMRCGVITSRPRPDADYDKSLDVILLGFGTILDQGETLSSQRVINTAGPGVMVAYHAFLEQHDAGLDRLPNAKRFVELANAVDPGHRHMALHSGHLTELNAIDRQAITGEAMSITPLACKPAELPERLDGLATQGITEVAFQPMGDVTRELTTFARAAGLQRAT
jgi:5,10-methylenetetrahydromethanopterin reductase